MPACCCCEPLVSDDDVNAPCQHVILLFALETTRHGAHSDCDVLFACIVHLQSTHPARTVCLVLEAACRVRFDLNMLRASNDTTYSTPPPEIPTRGKLLEPPWAPEDTAGRYMVNAVRPDPGHPYFPSHPSNPSHPTHPRHPTHPTPNLKARPLAWCRIRYHQHQCSAVSPVGHMLVRSVSPAHQHSAVI